MTEDANPDADWTPLFEGYTAEGLLSQCQRWQEWTAGTYWDNCPRFGGIEAD